MKVHCINSQSALPIACSDVERLVVSFLRWKKISSDEVTVQFVSKAEITILHRDFFNDPTPTDCISFSIDSPDDSKSGYTVLGEIFVCPEVAKEYVKGGDPYREVTLYIIHALLHLIGYDDIEEEDQRIMRAEEKSAMLYLEERKEILHA